MKNNVISIFKLFLQREQYLTFAYRTNMFELSRVGFVWMQLSEACITSSWRYLVLLGGVYDANKGNSTFDPQSCISSDNVVEQHTIQAYDFPPYSNNEIHQTSCNS